ncbi:MAG: hypothetical protein QM775_25185 [Pirellulales bacterium]
MNSTIAGASGRRTFMFFDWDGDGILDLLVNTRPNVNFLKGLGQDAEGHWVFEDKGARASRAHRQPCDDPDHRPLEQPAWGPAVRFGGRFPLFPETPDAENSQTLITMPALTPAQLHKLKRWNTPTIANALEQVSRADPLAIVNRDETKDFMPEMGPMVGYAMTLVISGGDPRPKKEQPANFERYREYLASLPGPKIVVVQDADQPRCYGSISGEVGANHARALGCVGTITDGAVRDLDEMKPAGFKAIARRLAVSHAHCWPLRWGVEVEVFGTKIRPGPVDPRRQARLHHHPARRAETRPRSRPLHGRQRVRHRHPRRQRERRPHLQGNARRHETRGRGLRRQHAPQVPHRRRRMEVSLSCPAPHPFRC